MVLCWYQIITYSFIIQPLSCHMYFILANDVVAYKKLLFALFCESFVFIFKYSILVSSLPIILWSGSCSFWFGIWNTNYKVIFPVMWAIWVFCFCIHEFNEYSALSLLLYLLLQFWFVIELVIIMKTVAFFPIYPILTKFIFGIMFLNII